MWQRGTPIFEVPGHGSVCWVLDSRERHIWAEWRDPSGGVSRLPLDVVVFVVTRLDPSYELSSPADAAWPPVPRGDVEPLEEEVEDWGACSLTQEEDESWWLCWRPAGDRPSVRMPLAAALTLMSGPAADALMAPRLQPD